MNLRLLTLLTPISLVALLGGCKAEEKSIAAKDYPQEMARGYCEAAYSCSCEDPPYPTFNACLLDLVTAYDQVNDEAFVAGLAYDGTCPVRELDAVDSLACKISVSDSSAQACVNPCKTWHGFSTAGQLCAVVVDAPELGVSFSTCAQGLTCVTGVCVDRCRTVELPGLGQACPDLVCESGAVCDLETQVCMVEKALPGPGDPCEAGACDPDVAVCVSGAGVCAALPSIGQSCLDGQCDGQSTCGDNDVCLARPALICGLIGNGGLPGGGGGGGGTDWGASNVAACNAYFDGLAALECWDFDVDPQCEANYADVSECDLSGYFECAQGAYSCVDGFLSLDEERVEQCAPLAACGPGDGGDGDGDEPEPWWCGDGTTIPLELVCDGTTQCPNRADEIDGCGLESFVCQSSGTHIPADEECDGFWNCDEGEDESDCGSGTFIPP